jgi:hypothetical protein
MNRQLPGTITTGKPAVRHFTGTSTGIVPSVRQLPGTCLTPKINATPSN